MIKTFELTNAKIYEYAMGLLSAFNDASLTLPVKLNFYFNKNKKTIVALGEEIESERMKIISKYGEPNEDGNSYNIKPENIAMAQKELNELLNILQEVTIHYVTLEDFGNITLTQQQMDALMFMIDEEGE